MTTKSAKQFAKKSAKGLSKHLSSHSDKISRSFVAPLENGNDHHDGIQVLIPSSPALTEADLPMVDIDRDWVRLSPQSSWAKYEEAWLMQAAECSVDNAEKGIHPQCGVWAWIPEYGTVLLQLTDYETAQ